MSSNEYKRLSNLVTDLVSDSALSAAGPPDRWTDVPLSVSAAASEWRTDDRAALC